MWNAKNFGILKKKRPKLETLVTFLKTKQGFIFADNSFLFDIMLHFQSITVILSWSLFLFPQLSFVTSQQLFRFAETDIVEVPPNYTMSLCYFLVRVLWWRMHSNFGQLQPLSNCYKQLPQWWHFENFQLLFNKKGEFFPIIRFHILM